MTPSDEHVQAGTLAVEPSLAPTLSANETSATGETPASIDLTRGYAFLLNVESVPVPADAEILPGHILRRAMPSEINCIKTKLTQLAPSPLPGYIWEEQRHPTGGPIQMRPPEAWRYFIVTFEGGSRTMSELSNVFTLSDVEPLVGLTIIGTGAVMWNGSRLFHTMEHAWTDGWMFHAITQEDIRGFRKLFRDFQNHNHELLDLRRVTAELTSLNSMSHASPLRFLGYFALLESLLTHAPKATDPYDSITRQVKKKLTLLNRRFDRPIDYTRFGTANSDTVWGKMYSYRSAIAHGGMPDFTKELALLKNPSEALKLLRGVTKAVARLALVETQLLVDLREC